MIGIKSIASYVPTAGIEQNGPHLPLYKHRRVVRVTSESIAAKLGGVLIAPIIDFVPEGDIKSRQGHMAYPGTISMTPDVFVNILKNTARSLVSHGFVNVVFIGDSGDSQDWQARAARALRDEGLNVYHIDDYYANETQVKKLKQLGFTEADIGEHSGLRDTSEFMAVAGSEVRRERIENITKERYDEMGNWGDLTKASAEIGVQLLEIKVDRAVAEICKLELGLAGCAVQKPN